MADEMLLTQRILDAINTQNQALTEADLISKLKEPPERVHDILHGLRQQGLIRYLTQDDWMRSMK